ncbi:hypothetical protein D5086_024728 [Populus alba]|uniref:Uncharacterized protein n=1 Tax=Populus alba TaxID=43335 RepID=A0ACC4B6C2_POPAL
MAISIILPFLPLIFFSSFSSSTIDRLSGSSSLSVEHADDVLTSPNGDFSAGFFPVGDNAYCFAIWFCEPYSEGNRTIVWMANRDQPVNGRKSELSLRKSGNAIITDAGRLTVWSTNTVSESPVFLYLHENGNLILQNSEGGVLWQSFDSPTDTLLPQQLLTKDMQLVSSRSQGNFSSRFYKLYFDDDNVLRLLYGGPEISVYWPDPELLSWEASRSTYNSSRIAFLDSLGYFSSSDNFTFMSADYGERFQRILKLDFDEEIENRRLVTWVREKMKQAPEMSSWIEMIIDPKLEGKYDKGRMEILFEVALKCVAEDRDARPTMSQVVEMILHQENDSELV